MRIFVLGAGRMGSVVAMDLSRQSKSGIEVGVGDVDYKRAKSVADRYENAEPFEVDITKTDELATTLKRYDAVVNASWFEFNLLVMKACFKAHCDYNDLGGLFHMTKKQLSLEGEAKRAEVSAIVGGGESPGITNVMARYCAEDLSTLDSVSIYAGSKEVAQKNVGPVFPFSVSTVIDEYSVRPVEFLEGEYREVPPLSGTEEVEFPRPIGSNTVHYSIHSETATLPYTLGKGVRSVTFKLGSSKAMLETLAPLISMGFTSEDKIPVNGTSISPKEFLVSFFNNKVDRNIGSKRYVALRTVAVGTRKGKKRKARVQADLVCGPQIKDHLGNATAYLTGVAGSIFGQFLANGKVPRKGVIAPESAVDPERFLAELDKRNIRVAKRNF